MNDLWLSWHMSRRSVTLAQELNVPLFAYVNEKNIFSRHFLSSLWTVYILIKERPEKIFMQYSFMLLVVVYLYKKIRRQYVYVVCDCHTKALRRKLNNKCSEIFLSIKKTTFKSADICIISNSELIPEVKRFCEKYVILPDPIPKLTLAADAIITDMKYCVYSNSYAVDEPLEEVINAAKLLEGKVKIIITGRIPKSREHLRQQPYTNIIFTDFLSDNEYNRLIANAQCVLALTTEESTLLCANYEALSVNTPLITSDTRVIREYFLQSVVYTKNSSNDIANSIEICLEQELKIKRQMLELKHHKELEMNQKLLCLRN